MSIKSPDYWFYLEPYTFLFSENGNFLVYNTLNGAYIDCSFYPEVHEVLHELYNSDKNYCIGLYEKQLKQKTLVSFIRKIRETFSGDIIKNTYGKAPFIFKPILRLYSDPENLRVKQENLLGLSSLLYLHEVAFYLENQCMKGCMDCNRYYKQFHHCTSIEGQKMQFEDYEMVIDQLELCQPDKICIIPGESTTDKELIRKLILRLQKSPLKKEVILHYTSPSEMIENYLKAGFNVKIMMHLNQDVKGLNAKISIIANENITWVFIVAEETDLKLLDLLEVPAGINYEVIPYFNGTNLSFFEKYVYNDLDDILREPVEKQVIFRRQVLNENFFGKLSVFPSGQVYANPNFSSLGNILNQKLTEIVYHEISDSKVWLKTREEGSCKKCINKYLCPSPNNYEVVIDKFDLCHIKNS